MFRSFTLKVCLLVVMVLSCVCMSVENVKGWESPTDQSLWGVWCSGYGWWAVGTYGTILWWNPDISVNDWEVWPRVTYQGPTSVFMRALNDGWMVGGGGGLSPSEILHYDGTDWRTVASGTNMPLDDVWAVSADDAWAVGQRIILRWNGISWNTHTTPSATLWAIHMVSATDGWAVGGASPGGGVIFHWDGTSWEEWPIPEGAGDLLLDVYMVDANDGWATGADGTILRWNGTEWSTVTSPTSVNLYGVTMTTADSGWAVGGSAISSGDGTIIRWDGTRWRPCTIQTTEWTLRSVDMVSDAVGGWAVGDAGTMIRLDARGYWGEVAIQYELTVAGSVGSGTTNPAPGNYWHDEDTDVSVDAQPVSGWMLDHWLLDGVDVGSADPYTVTMDEDHTLAAVFVEMPQATIESCNLAGATKNSFDLTEIAYVKGTDYSPSTIHNIYLVNDVASWSDGIPIPARIPGTATTVSSDSLGNIPPTVVWSSPLTAGKYDIVVDVNGNGLFDEGIDALDNNDIEVTGGFLVVPEFLSFLILPLFMITTLLAVITCRKRLAPP